MRILLLSLSIFWSIGVVIVVRLVRVVIFVTYFFHEYSSWYSWQIWALSTIYNIFIFVGYISIIFSWYCGQLYVRTGRISNQAGHQQRVFCQPDSQLYEQATQTQLLLLSFLISVVKHCHSILITYYVRFDLGLGYFGSIQWFLS